MFHTTERLSHANSTDRLRLIGKDEESIPVLVDKGRIKQVLDHYMINALTYSAVDLPVEISIQAQGQSVRFSVHDAGPGLTLEEQEHVWERFYRVQRIVMQAHTRGGLGLGLYI